MAYLRGIQSGMVMQRKLPENTCHIWLEPNAPCELKTSMGMLERIGSRYLLTGIPVGGPYTLTIFDGELSHVFEDLWVGDVWLLGGQSNMEGWGAREAEEVAYDAQPLRQIRSFYLDDHWDAAKSQLHLPWTNQDQPLAEKFLLGRAMTLDQRDQLSCEDAGVGPGLFIGKYLFEQTNIPQGLIPCAFGGTCMADWDPENRTKTSQYRHLIRRFWACGGNARGMFWYQGESDLNWLQSNSLKRNMERMLRGLRTDTGLERLPFVQVQIGISQGFSNMLLDNIIGWQKIRRQQYEMSFPYFSTVSAANASYQDLIHLDTPSQRAVGKAAAMEMLALLGRTECACPVLSRIEIRKPQGHLNYGKTAVVLTYDHILGQLESDGVPYGFSVTLFEEIPYLTPYKGVCHIRLRGNQVWLVTEYSEEQLRHGYVWYGAGPNTVCNIHDSQGRVPLAMGPIPIISE